MTRCAQDDDFVGGLKKNIPNRLVLLGSSSGVRRNQLKQPASREGPPLGESLLLAGTVDPGLRPIGTYLFVMFFFKLPQIVILRICDFFDLLVFSVIRPAVFFASPRQSRHPERSASQIHRKQRV